MKLLNELGKVKGSLIEKEREAELYKGDFKKSEALNHDAHEQLTKAREEQLTTIKENEYLKRALKETEDNFEVERLNMTEQYKALGDEFLNYKESSETKMKDISDDYEKILKDYKTQLEEKINSLEQLRRQNTSEMETKAEEIKKLTEAHKTVDEYSKSLSTGIKSRDDKITHLTDDLK